MATFQSNIGGPSPFARIPMSMPSMVQPAPAGTFLPGTKVQVGGHRVVVDKYLSEGGYAHVYVVSLPKPVDGHSKAVLKRVAVPDKDQLAECRNEVETMKRLRGHNQIVRYIDSHASPLKAGGYEVFLLMEWCNGGGLIDFMNTRLTNRLTEPEILKIFTDVAEGVACMHYLKPALMHRDVKIENVLITTSGNTKTFKLCDFGSAAPARPAALTAAEGRATADDVQRHTTLQYRSPEMVDVYRKQPIDEKSDIWALGCFLYKLCYYVTPFEEAGQTAILNATFKYPGYPKFSDDLKLLIASMLSEQPSARPGIYQVLVKASKMDNRPIAFKDRSKPIQQTSDNPTSTAPDPTPLPSTGASYVAPKPKTLKPIPHVEPLRRGRPEKPSSRHTSAKPSPSPLRIMDQHDDAFAALDNKDEFSSRFPKLEEFSLLSENALATFSQPQPQTITKPAAEKSLKTIEALADDAFVQPRPRQKPVVAARTDASRQSSLQTTILPRKRSPHKLREDKPIPAIKTSMVSTGTMTSPQTTSPRTMPVNEKPIWRVPTQDKIERSATIHQASSKTKPIVSGGSRLAGLLHLDASNSQAGHERPTQAGTASSELQQDENHLRLSEIEPSIHRSRSLNARQKPARMQSNHKSTSKEREQPAYVTNGTPPALSTAANDYIESDLDYLRTIEGEEKEKNKHMRRVHSLSRHQKRSSLPAQALSGTKDVVMSRFGDAFKRFENHDESGNSKMYESRNEEPLLSPIEGSITTDAADEARPLDETEELSPELKRELEKQRLEAEERRVERAAAEYKQRVGQKGVPPPPASIKAESIRNRVQSLLDDNNKPMQRTAAGYGHFTENGTINGDQRSAKLKQYPMRSATNSEYKPLSAPASSLDLSAQNRLSRPSAPPKPQVLRKPTTQQQSATVPQRDDWESNFSNKYPDLSRLEMVETDINGSSPEPARLRMREV